MFSHNSSFIPLDIVAAATVVSSFTNGVPMFVAVLAGIYYVMMIISWIVNQNWKRHDK